MTLQSRNKIGTRAGMFGILCNVVLFAAKLEAGLLTASVAVVADAFNNLTDAASSLMTFFGFRLAQRPADRDHPYGHARYEYLAGLGVAVLILLIGAELIRSSVGKIIHPVTVTFDLTSRAILGASVAVKLLLWIYFRARGNAISSATLIATARDSFNDVLVTAAILICSFIPLPADGYVGLAVALFILWSGIRVLQETVTPLLGAKADPRLVDRISDLVLSQESVLGIHDLLIHDYGYGQTFASVHVELSAAEDPLVCHDIIDDIECAVLEELNVHLVIHYDPVLVGDEEWTTLRSTVEEVITAIDPDLSMHDFRLVKGAKRTKLVFDLAVPYGFEETYHRLKEQIDTALYQRGIVYSTVIRFDEK